MDTIPQTVEDIVKYIILEDQHYCNVCNVKATNDATWASHLGGKKHKKLFSQELEKQKQLYGIVDDVKSSEPSEIVKQPEQPQNSENVVAKQTRSQKRHKKQRQIIQQQEEEEKLNPIDFNASRNKEIQEINDKVKDKNLHVFEVGADGNCLYRAICKQLGLEIPKYDNNYSYILIRRAAADYMREHSDDFVPFMEDSVSFEEYCNKVQDSNEWGGQLEIKAISEAYQRPIHVYSADQDTVIMGEQFTSPPFMISYHRQYLTLGNHYNSLVPNN
ncbi:hypothetical protein WA158_000062 [Blastocystis sp. Blastoise]